VFKITLALISTCTFSSSGASTEELTLRATSSLISDKVLVTNWAFVGGSGKTEGLGLVKEIVTPLATSVGSVSTTSTGLDVSTGGIIPFPCDGGLISPEVVSNVVIIGNLDNGNSNLTRWDDNSNLVFVQIGDFKVNELTILQEKSSTKGVSINEISTSDNSSGGINHSSNSRTDGEDGWVNVVVEDPSSSGVSIFVGIEFKIHSRTFDQSWSRRLGSSSSPDGTKSRSGGNEVISGFNGKRTIPMVDKSLWRFRFSLSRLNTP